MSYRTLIVLLALGILNPMLHPLAEPACTFAQTIVSRRPLQHRTAIALASAACASPSRAAAVETRPAQARVGAHPGVYAARPTQFDTTPVPA